jgi:hypothetical protein
VTDRATQRLVNQHLVAPERTEPSEILALLGAVQAQDYAGAKWALGQRLRGATDSTIEAACNGGAILRTHVLRPTWHFVAPADIRWLLALTGPRVHAGNRGRHRQLELDDAVLRRSHAALTRALRDGPFLTRTEIARALAAAGISTALPQRLAYILMHAELHALICSGPRRGKQFTYALLDERVPPTPAIDRDEALVELVRRYFTTRGPATPHDCAWWSGLTLADVRRALHEARADLEHETLDGRTFWFSPSPRAVDVPRHTAHLLPNYDEYFIGLRDRSAMLEPATLAAVSARPDVLIANIVLVQGRAAGGWKRTLMKNAVSIELKLLRELTARERRAVDRAMQAYAAFVELPLA